MELFDAHELYTDQWDIITGFNVKVDSEENHFFGKISDNLAKGGIVVISFAEYKDFEEYKNAIKNVSLRTIHKTENPFKHELHPASTPIHSYLCLAVRKD